MITAPRGFRQWTYSCKLIMNNTPEFGTNWRTVTSWVRKITQRIQLPPMIYCAIARIWSHITNHIHHPGRWRFSRVTIQTAENSPRKLSETFVDVTWYLCQERGHYAENCPKSTSNSHEGSQSLQVVITMTQKITNIPLTDIINNNWIMWDTWSTISSVRNRNLVQDIHACDAGGELQWYTNWVHPY